MDNLKGNAGNDVAFGGAGNDSLNGGNDADIMDGGAGADLYVANEITDVVREAMVSSLAAERDTVNLIDIAGTFLLGANIENLVLQGPGTINGTGSTMANAITGNGASNVITGGLGNDTLTGGSGSDFFVFNTAPNTTTNRDTFTDFSAVADTIRLENAVFTALGAAAGVLKVAMFKNTTLAAVDASDRILYNDATGAVL